MMNNNDKNIWTTFEKILNIKIKPIKCANMPLFDILSKSNIMEVFGLIYR